MCCPYFSHLFIWLYNYFVHFLTDGESNSHIYGHQKRTRCRWRENIKWTYSFRVVGLEENVRSSSRMLALWLQMPGQRQEPQISSDLCRGDISWVRWTGSIFSSDAYTDMLRLPCHLGTNSLTCADSPAPCQSKFLLVDSWAIKDSNASGSWHTLSAARLSFILSDIPNASLMRIYSHIHFMFVKPKKKHLLLHDASHAYVDNQPLTCNMLRHGFRVGLFCSFSRVLTLVVLTPLLSQEVHGWSATWLQTRTLFSRDCKQQLKRFYSFYI